LVGQDDQSVACRATRLILQDVWEDNTWSRCR
jgi:hypothetical protein